MRLTTALRYLTFIGAGFLAAPLVLAQDDSVRFRLAPASFSVPASWKFEGVGPVPNENVETAHWTIREGTANAHASMLKGRTTRPGDFTIQVDESIKHKISVREQTYAGWHLRPESIRRTSKSRRHVFIGTAEFQGKKMIGRESTIVPKVERVAWIYTPTDVLMFSVVAEADELPALEAQFDAMVKSASLR